MLRLPAFEFQSARSVDEAVALLGEHGEDALPVAGGTDLYANMKLGLFAPRVVVGLRSIAALRSIRFDPQHGLRIGALCSLDAIVREPAVSKHYPALAQAAAMVGTPEIRNMGTIGGNLCLETRCNYFNQSPEWREAMGYCLKRNGNLCRVALHSDICKAINASDTAPVMHAYDARLSLAGPLGERTVNIRDFYLNDGAHANVKRADEILTEIALPLPASGTRSSYRKLRLRKAFDFPLLGVAVALTTDAGGSCTQARVVLNAVGSAPLEVEAAGAILRGTHLGGEVAADAAEEVFKAGKPLENTNASLLYRKRMLRVIAQRALEDVIAPLR